MKAIASPSQTNRAIKQQILDVVVPGGVDHLLSVQAKGEAITGIFLADQTVYDFSLDEDGGLNYQARQKNTKNDAYLQGFFLAPYISPLASDFNYLQGVLVTKLDKDCKGGGKPCGNTCIFKGHTCQAELGGKEKAVLRRVRRGLGLKVPSAAGASSEARKASENPIIQKAFRAAVAASLATGLAAGAGTALVFTQSQRKQYAASAKREAEETVRLKEIEFQKRLRDEQGFLGQLSRESEKLSRESKQIGDRLAQAEKSQKQAQAQAKELEKAVQEKEGQIKEQDKQIKELQGSAAQLQTALEESGDKSSKDLQALNKQLAQTNKKLESEQRKVGTAKEQLEQARAKAKEAAKAIASEGRLKKEVVALKKEATEKEKELKRVSEALEAEKASAQQAIESGVKSQVVAKEKELSNQLKNAQDNFKQQIEGMRSRIRAEEQAEAEKQGFPAARKIKNRQSLVYDETQGVHLRASQNAGLDITALTPQERSRKVSSAAKKLIDSAQTKGLTQLSSALNRDIDEINFATQENKPASNIKTKEFTRLLEGNKNFRQNTLERLYQLERAVQAQEAREGLYGEEIPKIEAKYRSQYTQLLSQLETGGLSDENIRKFDQGSTKLAQQLNREIDQLSSRLFNRKITDLIKE